MFLEHGSVIVQAKSEQAFAARRAEGMQQGDRRHYGMGHALSAEAWMQEALTAKPDTRTGVQRDFALQHPSSLVLCMLWLLLRRLAVEVPLSLVMLCRDVC